MRRIYEGTALPQMMYACSIWSNASLKGKLYTKKTLNILEGIQARVARSICGAYKATSRAALNIETFILPIEQQIWKHNTDLMTRLLSSMDIARTAGFQLNIAGCDTQTHTTKEAHRNYIGSWQKIYSDMREKEKKKFDAQEQITPFITPPWRQGRKTHIDTTAE